MIGIGGHEKKEKKTKVRARQRRVTIITWKVIRRMTTSIGKSS